MANKRSSLPFDRVGGVINLPRKMIESKAYESLGVRAKVLIPLLQIHWRNESPVDYSVRQAARKIPCSPGKAQEAFDQLQDRGFVVVAEPSIFNSTRGSKARSWRLTWLPFDSKEPTRDWAKWQG